MRSSGKCTLPQIIKYEERRKYPTIIIVNDICVLRSTFDLDLCALKMVKVKCSYVDVVAEKETEAVVGK